MQRILVYQIGPQARQSGLLADPETFVEHQADDAIEDAVAEEFETLVVVRAKAAVRQRLGLANPCPARDGPGWIELRAGDGHLLRRFLCPEVHTTG